MPVRRVVALGALVLVSYAYFYQGGDWNQNSRFDLVRAITEQHTMRIDKYAANTGDKSTYRGHKYSDKAPGTAFTAVPFVAGLDAALQLVGIDVGSGTSVMLRSYVATFFAAMVPAALAVLCLFWLALRIGARLSGALFVAVTFAVGTPVFAYATMFFGHALTTACLLVAFTASVALRDEGSGRRDVFLAAVVGLAGGWAVVSDLTVLVPVIVVTGFALVNAHERQSLPQVGTALSLCALACAGVLFAYSALAFASAFHVGYSDETNQFPGMRRGVFGIGSPRLYVLEQITVGHYRGLVFLAPVLAFAPVGLVLLWRKGESRIAFVSALIVIYFLLLNAGYFYWQGGSAFPPRFLTPALPFLCLWLGALWTRSRRAFRLVLLLASGYGIAVCLAAVATRPGIADTVHNPVWAVILASILAWALGDQPHKLRDALLHASARRMEPRTRAFPSQRPREPRAADNRLGGRGCMVRTQPERLATRTANAPKRIAASDRDARQRSGRSELRNWRQELHGTAQDEIEADVRSRGSGDQAENALRPLR